MARSRGIRKDMANYGDAEFSVFLRKAFISQAQRG
jgi:hypothetical protein